MRQRLPGNDQLPQLSTKCPLNLMGKERLTNFNLNRLQGVRAGENVLQAEGAHRRVGANLQTAQLTLVEEQP